MSTVPTYRSFNAIRDRLVTVRTRWKIFQLVQGTLAVAVLFLALCLFVALLESFLHFPVFGRVLLLVVSSVALVAGFILWLVRPGLRPLSDEQVARHVETAIPEMRNGLINSVQLARDELAPSPELVDRAIDEVAGSCASHDLGRAISGVWLRRLALAAAALVAALVLFSLLYPGRLSNALARIISPTDTTLPVAGSVEIVEITPAKSPVEVVFGDPLDVKVKFRARGSAPVKASLVWKYRTGEGSRAEMAADSPDAFSYRVSSVEVPLVYYVKLNDTESRRFEVTVLQKPFVTSVDVEYRYPAYTGLKVRTAIGAKGDVLEAPVGTYLKMRAHASRPVTAGEIRFTGDGPKPAALSVTEKGRVLEGLLYVHRDISYSFYLVDPTERGSQETGLREIRAIPDRKPTAEIVSPGQDVVLAPGETSSLAARATDDYGLVKVTLWMKRNDEKEVALKSWTRFDDPKSETAVFALELDKASYKVGEVLSIWAQVEDNCEFADPAQPSDAPRHHETTSAVRRITIRDRAQEKKDLVEDLRSWKEKLEDVLRTQQKARAAAATFAPEMTRADFLTRAGSVEKDQLTVYQHTVTVVDEMGKVPGEAARVARITLGVLARNEMVKALQLSAAAAKLDNIGAVAAPRDELVGVQDKIIATLRKVLDLLPEIEKQGLKDEKGEPGTEMPQDSEKKWKDLADKLKDFVDEQKKVIAATQDLAKKPVDNFTPEDEDRLKELKAVEDEWSKFMQEMHKDLSNLPNQDFSNPSLLKELSAVQEDVQKAADALTRKATEIAVPLEQSGVENAETLTTHIEKWLPDSADRDQWKMEEPTKELETPMAELPKELEDIVGKLMEQEEDLFEEVEDASSGWTDSIDKGAGWDAMDGPISNMSAQGVTGNRLPNSSEIGGRSGEGREGKSSGEMVGDEASGKGGRRTPTRLTPDPYEKGEVKDSSTDPAGGATGGGKVSGASKEGLEGPVPGPLQKKMQRLAGKQADLRNRAERVSVAFKVLNYNTSEADKVVAEMKSVEDDLRNYRYQNVLRKKQILLKGLQTARLVLENQIAVTKDTSATLPPEVQREIMDTAEMTLPPEYEELVNKYYESLSEK